MSFAFDDAKVREKYAEFKLRFKSDTFIAFILIAWTVDVELLAPMLQQHRF